MVKRKTGNSFKCYDESNRKVSLEKGEKTYLSIKSCVRCGNHVRYVKTYACLDCELRKQKEHYSRPSTKVKRKEHKLKKYGITGQEYDQILLEQNERCAICGKHQDENDMAFAVDHDHNNGMVRGLLCSRCNTSLYGIEYFMDNDNLVDGNDLFKHALAYLKKATTTRLKDINNGKNCDGN